MFHNHFYLDANTGAGGGAGGSTGDQSATKTGDAASTSGNNQAAATFEDFYGKLSEADKKLIDGHVSGLNSALKSERDQAKSLLDQLRDAQKKAEKGSEAEKQLAEMVKKQEIAERRIAFAEEAIKPEIGCVNIKAAFLLAQADDLFKKDGSPDWDAIKKSAPELFKTAMRAGTHGGSGTGTNSQHPVSMNEYIRSAARR